MLNPSKLRVFNNLKKLSTFSVDNFVDKHINTLYFIQHLDLLWHVSKK